MLGDAPCRFPYSYLHAAKKAGARVSVINGWLYGERPVARLDLLEQRMLGRAYVNAIDLCFAQTDGVAQTLLGAGMSEDRLHVTGSLKFDQMAPAHGAPPKSGAWWEALRSKSRAPDGGPTIVAGCVTEPEEQRFVLDAFSKVRANRPDAQLVMVPRHPEKPDRMQALECLLGEYQLPFAFRTKWQQTPVENFAVLVLDTIGELKHFYEVGDFVYVGKDHNVLEPLAYAKPVHVSGSWQRRYPSYPIYTQCLDGGLIASVTNSDALADAWSGIPEPVPADQLDGQRGATAYVLERLLNDAGKAA